nr:MAG TPA: hypothetical protein [Bacteriophage sp.]
MLKRIKIEDSVTGGHGEVLTNVDCIDDLRDFLKAYASARDVNNDEGKTFLFYDSEFDSEDSLADLLDLFGAYVAFRPDDIFEVVELGGEIVI